MSGVRAYLLDARTLGVFGSTGTLSALQDAGRFTPLVVVEEVRDELTKPGAAGATAMREFFSSGSVHVRGIPVSSHGSRLLAFLRRRKSSVSKDMGEHASIALGALDADLVFVAHDRKALDEALGELIEPRERVIRTPTFIRRLVEAGTLDGGQARALATDRTISDRAPSWWEDRLRALK